MAVPWSSVYIVPDSISSQLAVASIVQGLTALTFLTEAYSVSPGDRVLIHTVAGGLGLLMSQIAHNRGALVIGTTSSKDKASLAKQNGADHVILYKEEDTVKRVLEITEGKGVDVIYDGVGKSTSVPSIF
jgi:NADPH2:quinone reductase